MAVAIDLGFEARNGTVGAFQAEDQGYTCPGFVDFAQKCVIGQDCWPKLWVERRCLPWRDENELSKHSLPFQL